MSKRNISSKVPNGRVLHTRDKDLQGGNGYEKKNQKVYIEWSLLSIAILMMNLLL